jgi:hypothetical protein
MAKCGDGKYVKAKWSDIYQGRLIQMESLIQLKSPVAIVTKSKSPLTEADKLNGIEWEGSITIMAVAHREYFKSSGGWSGWIDGAPYRASDSPLLGGWLLDSTLYKQKGRWNVDEETYDSRVTKPSCSEIPD